MSQQLSETPSPYPVGTLVRDRALGDTFRVTEEFLTTNGNLVATIESINWEDGEEAATGAITSLYGYVPGGDVYPRPADVDVVTEDVAA